MIKRIVVFLCILFGVATLGVALFSYTVIMDLPLNELQEFKVEGSVEHSVTDSLDEGSRLLTNDFHYFWTWNQSDIGFTDELNFKVKANNFAEF